MLEEQLPEYKLRVDSLYLYENQDWIQSPACPTHVPETISPVHAEETFRYMCEYFWSCSEEVFAQVEMKNLYV